MNGDNTALVFDGKPWLSTGGPRREVLCHAPRVCAITDVGRVREHNEDRFFVSPRGDFFIVADGMGGHLAGEVASTLAVKMLAASLEQALPGLGEKPGGQELERVLTDGFHDAQQVVLEAAQMNPERRGMGTTLIVAYVRKNELYTCHVGDVRGYVISENRLEAITEDHSIIGRWVRKGELDREAARLQTAGNDLLQAIGDPNGILPEVNHRILKPGDQVLLCSDGLWKTMPEAELAELARSQGDVCCRAERLIERAIQADGRDNVTVILVQPICDTSA